jgi:hypothetical protein
MFLLLAVQACDGSPLKVWHSTDLSEEFTAEKTDMLQGSA